MIEKSGGNLRNDLEGDQCTFFAPTNQALKHYHELTKGGQGGEGFGKGSREPEMPSAEDILKYHIVKEQISIHDMVNGELLETELKVKALGDKNQLINVKRILGSVVLNNLVHVSEISLKANNGYIHPVEFVLIPPTDAFTTIFMLPMVAGIFSNAVQRCELEDQLMKEDQAMTVLVPSDCAWKELNIGDLVYLFSPLGCKDLKQILQYHICTELNYAVDIIEEEKEFEMPTMNQNEQVSVKVIPRSEKKRSGIANKYAEKSPSDYLIVLNCGEANVKCADVITSNGNVHVINSVLIPESVSCPVDASDRARVVRVIIRWGCCW